MVEGLKECIRSVPDFPKKGILFRDITPALLDPAVFGKISDFLYDRYSGSDIDKIAAIESRGFIFASVLAYRLKKGFIPLRKTGKLPWKKITETYELEYGQAALEMHIDAVASGDNVLIVDDLLATGGTARAAANLIERMGGRIEELMFVIELTELVGREKLKGRKIFSMLSF
jgi:adenine phosphoribosyltransferase